jgi:preprotein translocase subunit SecA
VYLAGVLCRYIEEVAVINALEPSMKALADEDLKAKTGDEA